MPYYQNFLKRIADVKAELQATIDTDHAALLARIAALEAAPAPVTAFSPGGMTTYSVGRWIDSRIVFGSMSTSGKTAGQLVLTPLIIGRTVKFDAIGLYASQFTPTTVLRLGLYNATTRGEPGTLIVERGIAASTSSSGMLSATVDLTLQPGLYFLASVVNSNTASWGHSPTAATPVLNIANGFNNDYNYLTITNVSYVDALPTPFPMASATYGANTVPQVSLRVAT